MSLPSWLPTGIRIKSKLSPKDYKALPMSPPSASLSDLLSWHFLLIHSPVAHCRPSPDLHAWPPSHNSQLKSNITSSERFACLVRFCFLTSKQLATQRNWLVRWLACFWRDDPGCIFTVGWWAPRRTFGGDVVAPSTAAWPLLRAFGVMWWHPALQPGHCPGPLGTVCHSGLSGIPGYAGLLALSARSDFLYKAFRNFWGHGRTRIGQEQPGDTPQVLCGHYTPHLHTMVPMPCWTLYWGRELSQARGLPNAASNESLGPKSLVLIISVSIFLNAILSHEGHKDAQHG